MKGVPLFYSSRTKNQFPNRIVNPIFLPLNMLFSILISYFLISAFLIGNFLTYMLSLLIYSFSRMKVPVAMNLPHSTDMYTLL